ncbi:unnamed protein product [Mytilus coruscus]|uniref:SWIM-type domain-containing protein n=1 Tax=Mytilus coruscus TaxID=42192 RepID=A0A6J8A1M7_MYTCO|nr:unnamed protein product [Mytilus coruscus]
MAANDNVKTSDSTSTKDLTCLPAINFSFVESVVKSGSKSQGDKEIFKGYKYFSEKYLFDISGPVLESSSCSCAIGKSGTCCHVTGLLYTLAHTKASNLKSIPSDILKTSLPQTWPIPRGEKLKGSQVDDVVVCGYNSKSPYRQPHGLRSTLYYPSKIDFPPVRELYEAVSKVDNSILELSVCSGTSQETTEFDEDFPILPIDNFMLNTLQVALDRTKTTSFNAIQVSMDETRNIEVMTWLKSDDPRWHAVRRDRLTASVAGDIVKTRAGLLSTK